MMPGHTRQTKSHEACRLIVCFGCGLAPVQKRAGPSGKTLINRAFSHLTIDWGDDKYPLGLCSTCRRALNKLDANNFSNQGEVDKLTDSWSSLPWISDDVFALPSSQGTLNSGNCTCKICVAAKSWSIVTGTKSIDRKNPFGAKRGKAGRPAKVSTGLICNVCLKEVTEGVEHKCDRKSRADRRASLLKLAEADPRGSQMIAAKVLKNLPGSPRKGTKRLVQSRGRPIPVSAPGSAPVRSNSKRVSARNLAAISAKSDLSARKRKKLVSDLNKYHKKGSVSGRKVFKANVESKINKMKLLFATMFDVTEEVIDGVNHFIAHVKSKQQFVEYIKKCRGIDHGNILNRVSLDSGGGFLKMSINIIDMLNASDPERLASKRRLNPDRIGSHGDLDSGINGLFITCLAQEMNESPEAFRTFFNLTSLKDIVFKFANDFKVHNLLSGLKASNATCPCPYCTQLRQRFDEKPEKGTERTVGGNIKMFEEFELDGGVTPANSLGKFDSICREPLLPGFDEDDLILHCIPPPELHLMEGITNHVLTKIRHELGLTEFNNFLHTLNLDRERYEKYTKKCNLEGNDCMTILNHIIDFILFSQHLGAVSVQPHLNFLMAFCKVVKSCFGFHLEPDYRETIDLAKEAFDSLVSVTAIRMPTKRRVRYFYKIHVLVYHVCDFIDIFGPLGPYSEQAGETVHSWWKKLWVSYRSLPMTQGERLKAALVEWNWRRISLILGDEDDDDSEDDE